MTLEENFVSSSLERVTGQFGVIQEKQAKSISEQLMEQLGVVPKRSEALAASLSGGNQQKVLLGKWLSANPRVLIVDEPSRGVDIGAKSNIHFLLRELADRGMAILMISSDLPEILGLSDRVMVMHEGRLKGILGKYGSYTRRYHECRLWGGRYAVNKVIKAVRGMDKQMGVILFCSS